MTFIGFTQDSDHHLQSGLRKATWRLIPLLSICYLAAFMDRANISFAAESMNRDLHFSAAVYGLGAGLFFVSYALLEIPSNLLLLRFGAKRWIARIMLTWGLLAAAMMLVRGAHSFYILRLLLGAAEAGFFPGVLYYLAQWYPPRFRARALARFYMTLPLANLVMGGLAGALLRLNGTMGLRGWQWLFLVEGLPAVVLSAVILWRLPDGPRSAKWLAADEVNAIEAEVRAGGGSAHAPKGATWTVLRSGTVWLYGLFYFLTIGSYYAQNFYLPLMLRGLTGWSPDRVGWLIAGMGVVAAGAMVAGGWSSDRSRERLWHVLLPVGVMAAALVTAGAHSSGWVAVSALLLVTVAFCAMQGPVQTAATRTQPGAVAAVAIALGNASGNTGGFAGPYLMGWLKDATGGYSRGLMLLCVPLAAAMVCMMVVLLRRLGPEQ